MQKQPSPTGEDFEDEPPLLEGKLYNWIHFKLTLDLGIEPDKILAKFKSIISQRGIKENADYDDMAGPLLVCVLFGILLLFVSHSLRVILLIRKEKSNSDTSMDLA